VLFQVGIYDRVLRQKRKGAKVTKRLIFRWTAPFWLLYLFLRRKTTRVRPNPKETNMNRLKQVSEENYQHTYKAILIPLKSKHKKILSSLCLFIALCVPLTVSAFQAKIVGGNEATANAYPFMVSVEYQVDNSQFCGASLITENKVLTAAHCITDDNGRIIKDKIQVRLGTNVLNDGSGTVLNIKSIARHPLYNNYTLDYDVAILILKTPVKLDDNINVINLPKACQSIHCLTGLVTPGTSVRAIGWGMTSVDGEGSDILLQVDMPIISNIECQTTNTNDITDSMICADGTHQNPVGDTCQGDSGGPLFAYIEAARAGLQTGIVSFGEDCAMHPGVYARISDPIIRAFILKYAGI
jgi:secreted trypsin-like serine protease